jgi:hypothetical protein
MAAAESKHRVVVVARDVVIGDADLKHVRSDEGTTTIIFDRRVAERRQHDDDHIPERRRAVDRRGQSGHRSERAHRVRSWASLRWLGDRTADLVVGASSVLFVLILIGLMHGHPAPTRSTQPVRQGPATTGAPPRVAAVDTVERPLWSARAARSMAVSPRVPHERAITRNQLAQVTATDVSPEAVQVALDYRYVGDQGRDEVFIHAAALQGDDTASLVPGTEFPGAPIAVGSGRVTITIGRVPDAAPAASTHIRVCMVSLRTRSVFLCETFPFGKAWASLPSAELTDQ